jgi:hypothetical protein
MGKAFDATGSYAALLAVLAVAAGIAALLLNLLPRYPVRQAPFGSAETPADCSVSS